MAISAEGYFQANPDVAAAYAANSYGMSPEQYAQTHYTNYGAAEGRYLPEWANSGSSSTTTPASSSRERIEGLPTNPYDPNSASLAYNQGSYLADGHYGQPVWEDGQIVGYDFMQHDVTPGMVSNIKTDLQGNIVSRAVTPEGESINFGDVARMALTMYGMSTGLTSLFGGAGLGAAGAGLTAEQALAMEALGGAEVAGGLTAAEAAAAGLGGGFTGIPGLLAGAGMTAEQVAAMEGLGGAEVAGGLTAAEASAAGLGGGFTGVPGLLAGSGAGNGAWLGDTATVDAATNAGTTAASTAASTGLSTSQIANLAKAGLSLAGVAGATNVAANAGGGNSGAVVNPTQGVPTNNPEYYNQLQQYYNAYLPQTPRDVVSPLQQWYNSSYGA